MLPRPLLACVDLEGWTTVMDTQSSPFCAARESVAIIRTAKPFQLTAFWSSKGR